MQNIKESQGGKGELIGHQTIINAQPVQQPQPALAQQPHANKSSSQKQRAPQQLQRALQQAVKTYVPMYQSPNATTISQNSILTH